MECYILSKILKPIGRLIKLDPTLEEVSKGIFVKVCLEVDVSKPLKMKIKYFRDDSIYECFIDYENITNICYRCGSHYHKFDSCYLNSKSVSYIYFLLLPMVFAVFVPYRVMFLNSDVWWLVCVMIAGWKSCIF